MIELIDTLLVVIAEVKSDHEEWEKRTGLKRSVPFTGDSPCYYCGVYGGDYDACRVCIHNPENELEQLLEEEKRKAAYCGGLLPRRINYEV